jgi:heavy metal sensor kinase
MRVRPLALRTQLSLIYSVIVGLLITTLSLVYYHTLARQLDADATENLTELTSAMHGYLRFNEGLPSLVYDASDLEQVAFIETASRYYQVYDADDGRLLVQSRALQPLGLQYTPEEVRAFREDPFVGDVSTDRGRIRLSNSLLTPSPGESYLLQVGVSLDAVDAALDHFFTLLLWVVPTSVLVVCVTGPWMARWALAPLAGLAAKTRAITVADLGQRLPVRGAGDELDALAEAFNDTLARLERSVGEMRQWSTAIAHELRTPLAALRGEAELALMRGGLSADHEQTLVSQLEEFDKLSRLITQLLTLARAEAGEIPLASDRVPLAPLVESIVEQMEPLAAARDLSLRCGHLDPAVVYGDAAWLERLILNLIDNAIKFTQAGGEIAVTLRQDQDTARLEVADSGIGIEAAAVPHLFERFYRADPSRSPGSEGTGLGLSLAKWIVDRHHGRIDVTSEPGRGSTFAISLPSEETVSRP